MGLVTCWWSSRWKVSSPLHLWRAIFALRICRGLGSIKSWLLHSICNTRKWDETYELPQCSIHSDDVAVHFHYARGCCVFFVRPRCNCRIIRKTITQRSASRLFPQIPHCYEWIRLRSKTCYFITPEMMFGSMGPHFILRFHTKAGLASIFLMSQPQIPWQTTPNFSPTTTTAAAATILTSSLITVLETLSFGTTLVNLFRPRSWHLHHL